MGRPMRLIHCLALLLTLITPAALADDLYHIEMVLIQQNQLPALNTAATAPEDWAAGSQRIEPQSETKPRLQSVVDKLVASNDYSVLLHKSWQQTLGQTPTRIALSSGTEHYGHFPIQGTLDLTLDRFTDVTAKFWLNQFDPNGLIVSTERLSQKSRTKNGELNFIDNGHLALLLKITSLAARHEPPPGSLDN